MKRILFGLVLTLVTISLHASDTSKDKYRMFPQPEEGYVRYIVEVPKTKNDYEHRIELLIGKKMMVDCNSHSFFGKLEKFPLKGWGYSYYKVSDIKNGPTTMRACNEPKKEAFILLYLPQKMQFMRYNSRMGIVIYVPKGFEVRYRIWSAEKAIKKAEQR
jgi:ecotin